MTTYRLLQTFEGLFRGKPYLHRRSNLGDFVAQQLYEDLFELGRSEKLKERIAAHKRVLNVGNRTVGIRARRGDGTFGEIVPAAVAITDAGFGVARGPIARVEIGAESKILAKAMIKQIDRVMGDLLRQAEQFKRSEPNAITVGIVGINRAAQYTSFEGDRSYPTDGKKHRHPVREAPEAERRLLQDVAPKFDHFLILGFVATNQEPFAFEWVNTAETASEYAAMLTRISVDYDRRF